HRLLETGEIPAINLSGEWLVPESKLFESLDMLVERQTEKRRQATAGHASEGQAGSPSLRSTRRREVITYSILGTMGEAASAIDLLAQVLDQLAARDPSIL